MPARLDDLVVLAADGNQKAVLDALLTSRRESLQIREVHYVIYCHSGRDPGVHSGAAAFLRPFSRTHSHAIVLLDAEWEGGPGKATAIEDRIADELESNGWTADNTVALAVTPEIEAWAWGSAAVFDALETNETSVRRLASEYGWWDATSPKPSRPKELLEALFRQARKPRSSSIYAQIAQRASIAKCQDPTFVRLVEALRRWFPQQ